MNSKKYFRLFFLVDLIIKINSLSKMEIFYSKENYKYSLIVNLGSQLVPIPLSVDTSIPISMINSPKCEVCTNSKTYTYDPTKSKDSETKSQEIAYKKGKYEYKGTDYTDSISIATFDSTEKRLQSKVNFISITTISLVSKVLENGLLSLSYYSNIFKQMKEKEVFVFECSDSSGTITLGGINTDIINTTQLVYFPIKTIEEEKRWYLNPKGVLIVNKTMTTPIEIPQKIVIDSTTWHVHVPKTFFIDHSKLILSGKCQVQTSGEFSCQCQDPNAYAFFPSYNFTFETGKLVVEPKDYLAYDPSSGYCTLFMNINYANDYWVLGINVLNNFYTIFDYENKQMAFFPRENAKSNSSNFLITLISVGLSSVILLFGGFSIYKRCINTNVNHSSAVVNDSNNYEHEQGEDEDNEIVQ